MPQRHDFRISLSQVRGASDADLAWAVIEPLWDAVVFSRGPRAVAETLGLATAGQRALLAVDWCQKEVQNGGFEQFFLNPTGVLSHEALEGFRLLGASAYAELLKQALRAFPGGVAPPTRGERARHLMRLDDRAAFFERLDRAFLDLLAREDLEVIRTRFVRDYSDQFFHEERVL